MTAIIDLTYKKDGLFTTFWPESKAGERACNELAAQNGGNASVFTAHADAIIVQLRAAGYTVFAERKVAKRKTHDDDSLLAELEF